ncbi:MAG: PEP-CTERM sorting domain-containing protein [Pirellulales bacterium]
MSDRQYRWLAMAAVAAICLAGASSALAVSANPFSPSVADIQALSDQTGGFSSNNQLSTIDAIHVAPDGIHLDVTWRVGTGSDPFGEFPGETFARVVLSRFTNGEDTNTGRLLNPPYDGIKWCLMSDQPVSGQPFIQTAPNWTYYQPPSTIPVPGDMSNTMVTLSFDDANNFAGITPNTIVHPDGNGQIRSNSFGLQLYSGFALTPGQPVPGHIWISRWVPEPSSAALMLLGMAGLVGRKRR